MKLNRLVATALMLVVVGVVFAATPKYIFYFIGDGMGIGQVQTLRTYYQNLPEEAPDAVTHFYEYPVMGFITTYSASNDITDSAAAGTALATGCKTRNGMIGMDADTVALTSIAKQMKAAGRGVAIMSSVCIDDATPSAFYASRPNRGDYYEIARQGAASNFDFLAGAYFRDPYGVRAKTPGNVFAEYEAAGYCVARGCNGYETVVAEGASKVLWLDNDTITENRIGYAVDGVNGDMTLPQMKQKSLMRRYKWHTSSTSNIRAKHLLLLQPTTKPVDCRWVQNSILLLRSTMCIMHKCRRAILARRCAICSKRRENRWHGVMCVP